MADARRGIAERLEALDPAIVLGLLFCSFAAAVFVIIYGGNYVRDTFFQSQPKVEEVHRLIHLGSSHTYTGGSPRNGNWSYMRTRDAEGNEFTIGMTREAILKCKVGQTVVVLRQGINAQPSDEGCERVTISNEQ